MAIGEALRRKGQSGRQHYRDFPTLQDAIAEQLRPLRRFSLAVPNRRVRIRRPEVKSMAARKTGADKGGGDQPFDRITFDPGKMGGRACIRGMRVTVGLLVSLVAEGLSCDEILSDYPYLEPEDIRQALSYAAWLAREEVIPV
jgi:uncharacterized protein (DUF433 family)